MDLLTKKLDIKPLFDLSLSPEKRIWMLLERTGILVEELGTLVQYLGERLSDYAFEELQHIWF